MLLLASCAPCSPLQEKDHEQMTERASPASGEPAAVDEVESRCTSDGPSDRWYYILRAPSTQATYPSHVSAYLASVSDEAADLARELPGWPVHASDDSASRVVCTVRARTHLDARLPLFHSLLYLFPPISPPSI
eukprot:979274-Pleurochrysis_carterae.AAC.2